MATHVVAACAFERLRRAVAGKADLFAVLRHRDDVTVPRAELAEDVDVLVERLAALEARGEIVLVADGARRSAGDAIVEDALRAFAGYHTNEVLAPRGGELVLSRHAPALLLPEPACGPRPRLRRDRAQARGRLSSSGGGTEMPERGPALRYGSPRRLRPQVSS